MPEQQTSTRKPRERQPVYSMTKSLYLRVIDDTCAKMKSEFVERGISEDILKELRALWERNVSKSGAIGGVNQQTEINKPKPDGNVGIVQQHLVVPPPSQQQVLEGVGLKRTFDHGADKTQERPEKQHHVIPQQDGPADDDDEDEEDDLLGSDLDDSEIDELNEKDDLADVDNLDEIDESKVKNMVLGQFERVHRSKNRWKVNLKGCVANINGKDYLFKKLTGEMDFS